MLSTYTSCKGCFLSIKKGGKKKHKQKKKTYPITSLNKEECYKIQQQDKLHGKCNNISSQSRVHICDARCEASKFPGSSLSVSAISFLNL